MTGGAAVSYDAGEEDNQAASASASPSLSGNQMKLLAIAAMTADHAMLLFPAAAAAEPLLRVPGRLAAPIMCFLVAEGYHHTSNLRRYIGRLLLFALLSHVPYNLYFGFHVLQVWESTSVVWSLLMGLVCLAAVKNERLPAAVRLGALPLCCILAYSADWNYIAVLLIVSFGVFREEPCLRSWVHAGIGGLYLLQGLLYGLNIVPRLGIFLSVPVLWMYNGRKGRSSRWLQYAFYWYYPVHLLVLWLLKMLLS